MILMRYPTYHRFCHLGMVLAVLRLCQPAPAQGQAPERADSESAPTRVYADPLYPDLRKAREIILSGVGAGFWVAGGLLDSNALAVPTQGLDPGGIAWVWDREAVGNLSLRAGTASDWTRNAAVVFPVVLALATGTTGERWHGIRRRSVVYAETFLISLGSTWLGKTTLSRARPYAYLSVEQRPDDSAYDVTRDRTFRSMPSAHASSAWTGVAMGVTEHLLSRPDTSWAERAGVGFLAGALAGATSALRVEAGQHFPSDVLAGAGIGIATGVTIPLLHRGELPLPPLEAWAQVASGSLAGTILGVLLAGGI